jgi:F-type H+-transporting ATPase subunit alpha
VGGAAQTRAMRQVAGRLRLDLAQFRSLAAFAQFGSDLDPVTRAQLDRGLRTTEVLKQPQFQPLRLDQQVMIIYAVTNGYLDDVPVNKVQDWETEFHRYMANAHSEIGQRILTDKRLEDDLVDQLKAAIEQFKKTAVV